MHVLEKNLGILRKTLNNKDFVSQEIHQGYWIKQDGDLTGNLDQFFDIDDDEQVPLMFAGFEI